MTVHIHRVDGEIYSVSITKEDIIPLFKSIETLLDLAIDHAEMNVSKFLSEEQNKALSILMREL